MSAVGAGYCYAELAVSSLAMAVTAIVITYSARPRREGQAELARGWLGWKRGQCTGERVTHLSTNPAQRRVTSSMRPTMMLIPQIGAVCTGRLTDELVNLSRTLPVCLLPYREPQTSDTAAVRCPQNEVNCLPRWHVHRSNKIYDRHAGIVRVYR